MEKWNTTGLLREEQLTATEGLSRYVCCLERGVYTAQAKRGPRLLSYSYAHLLQFPYLCRFDHVLLFSLDCLRNLLLATS